MEEREALQFGSLMHDAGKLMQRTSSLKLTAEDRSLESTCCPVYKDRYTHTHVLYTMKLFGEVWPDRFPLAEILATFHHRPETCTQSRLAKMVALADRLASGERHGVEAEANPRKARLISLFSSLEVGQKERQPAYFPLLSLSPDLKVHFPQAEPTLQAEESYDELWYGLCRDLKALNPDSEFQDFYTQVHHLLERYTIFVPSAAYRDLADVSLFHHLKATAAIAVCLYDLEPSEAELDELLSALRLPGKGAALEREAMWLVGADISGIQDFIYGISSKGALKGLRGRSVYLQMLAEAVALRLLNDFGLTSSNLLYCGGGHFYLLFPKSKGAEKALSEARELTDGLLIKAHRGKVAVSMAWEPLRFIDLLSPESAKEGGGFAGVWERLGARLAREKRAKFRSLLSSPDRASLILGPFPAGGDERACDLCGELTEEVSGRCSFCVSFQELAGKVARSQALKIDLREASIADEPLRSYEDVLGSLGVRFRFLRAGQFDPKAYLLNRTDFIEDKRAYLGFRFLAKHTPLTHEGDIVTLEDLAERASGIPKWGVLRADVDRLGEAFGRGLKGSDRSISRVTMLSYLLSLYFSAHVETLARQDPFHERISIVYSGGDDLFGIGSWSVLTELAETIYSDFRAFSANSLTLSAGVFLAPSKGYPVSQAGKLAGEEERLAKDEGRDRLTLFDKALPWSVLAELHAIEGALVRLIEAKAPRALLTLLFEAYEAQRQAREGELSLFPVWRLLYALRRLTERQRYLAEGIMALEKLVIRNLWLPEYGLTAVRMADYLTRRKEGGL